MPKLFCAVVPNSQFAVKPLEFSPYGCKVEYVERQMSANMAGSRWKGLKAWKELCAGSSLISLESSSPTQFIRPCSKCLPPVIDRITSRRKSRTGEPDPAPNTEALASLLDELSPTSSRLSWPQRNAPRTRSLKQATPSNFLGLRHKRKSEKADQVDAIELSLRIMRSGSRRKSGGVGEWRRR